MTFTNRIGQDIYIKMCSEDAPKVLRAWDSRIPFVCRESSGTDKLQVWGILLVALSLVHYCLCMVHI